MQRDSEQHLVIVRYSATHYLNIEWVYNSADIDKSKVIWARDMPEAQNEELVRYFKGRRVWLLDPDERVLLVHRWSPDGYTVVQRAAAGETVRAEPFDAIELRVGVLFGEEEEEA